METPGRDDSLVQTLDMDDCSVLDESEQIMDGRLRNSSKRVYSSGAKQLKTWIKANHPTHYSTLDDEIILPVPAHVLVSYFGSNIKKNNGQYKSLSAINSMRSSLRDIYHKNNVTMETSTTNILGDFVKGYKRKIADLKEKGEISNREGKNSLSMEGYRLLCLVSLIPKTGMYKQTWPHLYLLFQWNLLVRTVSVSTMIFEFLS